MKEVEDVLINFAEAHGFFDDGDIDSENIGEIISQSDSIQLELEELVCDIYRCLLP